MAFRRILNKIFIENGKTTAVIAAGVGASSIFCGYFIPNTFCLDKYQEIVQLYKAGTAVTLSQVELDRFNKTLDLTEIPQDERHLFKPFTVYGFDIFSAGSKYSKYGCIIGIPSNFKYTDFEKIDTSEIKIKGNSLNKEIHATKRLLQSLILSEDAQLYAIGREIKMAQSPKLILDITYGTTAVIGYYGISALTNHKLKLHSGPFLVRLLTYALIGTFTAGCYIYAKDTTQVYFEKKIDEELRNKSNVFRVGGEEFYSKILKRNQALRSLLGKDGEKVYTTLGNERYLIRRKHLPLVERKQAFEI